MAEVLHPVAAVPRHLASLFRADHRTAVNFVGRFQDDLAVRSRFFNLGVATSGVGVFSVYRTNGKTVRVIHARPFELEEQFFYQRKLNQSVAQ